MSDEESAEHLQHGMQFRSQPQSIHQSSNEGSGLESQEETPSVVSPEPEYGVDEESDVASLYAGKDTPGHIIVLFDDIKVK